MTRARSFLSFAALLLCSVLSTPLASQTFTRITTGNPIATDAGSSNGTYIGCSWIDYNNDGRLDLWVNQIALYRNDGGGNFTKVTLPFASQGSAYGNSWADIDNDGDLDLFVSGGNPEGSILYRNDGNDVFTRITSGDIGQSLVNKGWGSAWADYDNDGYVDLVVAAAFGFGGITGPNKLFHNNGDGTFTRIDTGAVVTGTAPYTIPTWADFDQDGDMDLFIGGGPANGTLLPDYLYQNMLKETGTAWFKRITTGSVATDVRDGQVENWIDYDNDGDLDVYITNYGGPAVAGLKNDLYRNDGGVFTKITTGDIVNDIAHSLSSVWADFDNDGDLDCLVTNDAGATNRYYQNNGDGTFTTITTGTLVNIGGPHFGATAGDYDGDGDIDLFVTGVGLAGNNTKGLWRNDLANGNSWLEVRCIGTTSNRAAIGARVRALALIGGNLVWQMREISAQNSFNSQNSLIAHFGFGDAAVVESLKVEWPSGRVDRFSGVAVDHLVKIGEGDSTPVVLAFPHDGGLNQLPEIPLRWFRDLYGSPYRLQVSTDSTFAGGFVLDDSLVYDTTRSVAIVSNNSRYFWRVRSAQSIHPDRWSSIRRFSNQIIPPLLRFPPNGGSFPASVTLRWSPLGGATSYDVETALDSQFAAIVLNAQDVPDTTVGVDSLVLHSIYYWRVRAKTATVMGDWSPPRTFVAEVLAPSTPVASLWNLVSVPVSVANFAKDSVFPGTLTGAYAFDADSGYSQTPLLENLRGYWLKFAAPETVQFTGSSPEIALALKHGWNLVGSATAPVAYGDLSTVPVGILSTPAYGYASGFSAADTLMPGKGYWVKASQAGTLLFAATAAAGAPAAARWKRTQEDLLNGLGVLDVQDAGGNRQSLYFGGSGDGNVDWWELPPVPPAGIFDVRYATGRFADVPVGDSVRQVSLRISASYPVTIRWNARNTTAEFLLGGEAVSLRGRGSVVLDSPFSTVVLRYGASRDGQAAPAAFGLDQNYPNPFNPATTIRFTVPEDLERVKLAVYDLLGRVVAVLFDGAVRAGRHAVSWDAGEAPAGVYYCRLEAGTNTETEKMLLMK